MGTNTHSNLTDLEIHTPYRQVFADATERLADATTYTSDDLYKLAYQVSTSEEYVLTAISPVTWTIVTVSGGGGENLAATLAIGNSTAGNNIVMSQDDDEITFGDNAEVKLTHLSSIDYFLIGGFPGTDDVSDVGSAASTSSFAIISRNRTSTDGTGAPSSGLISLQTGSTDANGAGATVGDSGQIDLKTGDANQTLGTGANSGGINLSTGDSAAAESGNIQLSTGQGDTTTGDIDLTTGDHQGGAGSSGSIIIGTGGSTSANTGSITLNTRTGAVGGTAGSIILNAAAVDVETALVNINRTDTVIDASSQNLEVSLNSVSSNAFKINETATGNFLNCSPGATIPKLSLGLESGDVANGVTSPWLYVNPHTNTFIEGANLYRRMSLDEDFNFLPQLVASDAYGNNPFWFVKGTNAGNGQVTIGQGRLNVSSNTTSNDSTIVFAGSRTSKWSDGGSWDGGGELVIGISISQFATTTRRVEFGIRATHEAMDDTTDDDKLIIRYDTSDGVESATNWVLVTSASGVETKTVLSAVAGVANSDFIRIIVDSSREVTVVINDTLYVPASAHTLGAINLGEPYFGVKTLAAGAAGISVGKVFGAYNFV